MRGIDGARSPQRFFAYFFWIVGFLVVSSVMIHKKSAQNTGNVYSDETSLTK